MKKGKESVPYSAIPINEVYSNLKSSEAGLSQEEAETRLKTYGKNEVDTKTKKSILKIFFNQIKSALIILLIIAAIISYFLGGKVDAIVILTIVVLNGALGFTQEYKAETAVRKLNKYIIPKARVLRKGDLIEIRSNDLVPGDIIYLKLGDIVPADARLIYENDLTTDDSILTGESFPVKKSSSIIKEKTDLPQHLSNIVFMGTSISSGESYAIVIATGRDTFFGKTASLITKNQEETSFEKNIKNFSNFLLKLTLSVTAFVFIANAFLGKEIFSSFLFAVALAVGLTPELLPIIITISLSHGAAKMAKQKVIIKRIISIEDLGNMDVLCSDKTGTLTEGSLSLLNYLSPNEERSDSVLLSALLSTLTMSGNVKIFESPIDEAIWKNNKSEKLMPQLKDFKLLDKNEFDFNRKRMSVLVSRNNKKLLIAKGSPDSILSVCSYIKSKNQKLRSKLNKRLVSKITSLIESYESQGYKVIALAEKEFSKEQTAKNDEKDLAFLGLLLFLDPPKKTVKEALQKMNTLNVELKIITGDSPTITRTICNEVGFKIKNNRIVTGEDLEKIDSHELAHYVNEYNVFSRVTPEQKYRIVESLKSHGHVVGFLGDGINDAPALKTADIGISVDTACGIARDSADIILLKKSLNVLAEGIIEGRKTLGNTTKYILNTMSANYGNMITVALSSLFLKFIPLLPSQILLNNLITDVPLTTVAVDNIDGDFVKKPRKLDMKEIAKATKYLGLISTVFDLILLTALIFFFKTSPEILRTTWFLESALSEIIVTFAIRTTIPFYKSKPYKWLAYTSIISIAVLFLLVYSSAGKYLFEFTSLSLNLLLFVVGITFVYFATVEVAKHYLMKKFEL